MDGDLSPTGSSRFSTSTLCFDTCGVWSRQLILVIMPLPYSLGGTEQMKIDLVEVFGVECALPAPLRWGTMEVSTKGGVLVRVRTNTGLEGIGEAGFSVTYLRRVTPVIRDVLTPLLVGKDPRLIGQLWQHMYDATHGWGRRGIETYAVSGVDIALWDLLGKACSRPVYELLGATQRELAAYAAPSLKLPAEAASDCLRAVERGFRAIKLRVGFDDATDDRIVSAAREAVGPDVDLIVDANMSRDYRGAVDIARRYRDHYGVAWLEEPIRTRSLYEYVDEHARLRAASPLPISGGESLFTRYEFVPVIQKGAFDIVQPDAVSVGGITEAAAIASMAAAHGVRYTPHVACSSGTGVGLAANMHVLASVANPPYAEYDLYDDSDLQRELLQEPLRAREGIIRLSDRPGLGVELDSAAVAHYRVDA